MSDFDKPLWDAKTVAAYLNCSPRGVTERYAPLPSFPAAIRLPTPTGGRGQLLFKGSEIIEWVAQFQEKNYDKFTTLSNC